MILRDWYITNERLGIACLTDTSVITYRAMHKIKSSSNKAMVSYGISSVTRKGVSWSQFRKGYKNNRCAISSWKSPFDWSWRMNTCLTVLCFQFQPRTTFFREPLRCDLSSSSYPRIDRYRTSKSIFVENCVSLEYKKKFMDLSNKEKMVSLKHLKI